MFSTMIPALTLALALTSQVNALSNLQAPSGATVNRNMTVTWSSDSSDSGTFTLALFSAAINQTYTGGLALANTVEPSKNQVTVLFPPFDPGSYSLAVISSSNSSDVLATSGQFTVNPAPSGSQKLSPTAAASSVASAISSIASSISSSIVSASASASANPSPSAAAKSDATRTSVFSLGAVVAAVLIQALAA
ncbi:unnamed protein product [Mycena citricolor]|uniref:Yeast cell wall synthesis Kre9/Knh1-like N-terminal domain-containing protein n=1 Tax=Mycena citricolor TaxID=2018698 RepID=A0AAD2HHU5_9AGAR|nr:unnamed protein product [Mycena citricolor]